MTHHTLSDFVRRLRYFIFISIAITLLTPLVPAFGATQLEWNANTETNLAGYKVHIGSQSGQYDTAIDVGLATRKSLQMLQPGNVYYLAVTAYDSDGLESEFSEEVILAISGTNVCLVPLRLTFSPDAPVTITFMGEIARSYFVQATVDFRIWQTVHTVTPSISRTQEWIDAEAPNHSKRFYRVITSHP